LPLAARAPRGGGFNLAGLVAAGSAAHRSLTMKLARLGGRLC